ncbi:MAG TPA: DUF3035 domain-containing protein [Azospirillum sp.]|nr:DUF3035 domain-containing protein [Azospirillum sp.]
MHRSTLTASPRRAATPILGLALLALALTGCSDARRAIGLDRNAPDEFAVVSRAPLTLPPDMRLTAPRPGALRPQEATPTQLAASSVFGGASRTGAPAKAANKAPASQGEAALLTKAGPADPGIRSRVDEETSALIVADKRWIDRLLFWQKQEQPYEIVDPKKESQRLREAQAQGKPVNDGVVPTIERKRKAPLEGLF